MSFQFTITEHEGIQSITLNGRLDSATASTLEKAIAAQYQAQGDKAVMDFTNLGYVSSAGLRVILMAAKRAKQVQGALVLYGLQPHVREVFEISGFLKILQVVDSREQALQAIAA